MTARLRAIAYNWRLHGLPRCDEYFFEPPRIRPCGRLIWPWQAVTGPETLAHAACRKRARAQLEALEAKAP